MIVRGLAFKSSPNEPILFVEDKNPETWIEDLQSIFVYPLTITDSVYELVERNPTNTNTTIKPIN